MPGPAEIASTRFQVGWRQYASGPVPSSTLRGGAARRRVELRLPERRAERGQRRPRGVEVADGERALLRGRRGAESRVIVERRLHDGGEVTPGRPLHPGDAYVASERDRPDPVLDPVPADGDERGREADVEGTRLHPDEPRGREVPQLVQEDERRETEDDDEPGHHLRPRQARRPANRTVSFRDTHRAIPA
jgi:hypothetical protein